MSGGYSKPDVSGRDVLAAKFQSLSVQVAELQRATGAGDATGDIKLSGASAVPAGFVAADGSSYLRSAQPALFNVYGTGFGSVDSTHFNVPNLTAPTPTTGTLRYIIKL